jgi:hypothetical protein
MPSLLEASIRTKSSNLEKMIALALDRWRCSRVAVVRDGPGRRAEHRDGHQVYYPLFRRHCRPSCYPDEHYVHTYVNMRHGASNSNRNVTYVDWLRSGPHPAMYGAGDVTPEFIRGIRMGPEPWRLISTCYLFARAQHAGTAAQHFFLFLWLPTPRVCNSSQALKIK